MNNSTDLYWRIKKAQDDMTLGFSRSINSASTSSTASLSPPTTLNSITTTSNSSNNNINNNINSILPQSSTSTSTSSSNSSGKVLNSPFDSMKHARLSPSALDPNGFSSNFILPRFAQGGPTGSFGYDLAIAEPERLVNLLYLSRITIRSAWYNLQDYQFKSIKSPLTSIF